MDAIDALKINCWHLRHSRRTGLAACAERVIPLHTPADCAGCPLHRPMRIEPPPPAPPATTATEETGRGKILLFPSWRVRAS